MSVLSTQRQLGTVHAHAPGCVFLLSVTYMDGLDWRTRGSGLLRYRARYLGSRQVSEIGTVLHIRNDEKH
jgi:hypothetical protein